MFFNLTVSTSFGYSAILQAINDETEQEELVQVFQVSRNGDTVYEDTVITLSYKTLEDLTYALHERIAKAKRQYVKNAIRMASQTKIFFNP